jgi:signal peptide peptidase SppA
MIRVLSRIKSEPWAITREAMDTILEIAARENESPQAVAAKLGRPLENTYAAEIRDGVGVLAATGPLFRYANLFNQLSGATSYDLLARDFAQMVDNPAVRAIVLNIDSPGGEASGVSEFADMIHAARGSKPIVAYVGGAGASAAYWIASAADEIVIDDTAMLGSIGVVLGIQDTREREAKAGVRRMEIVSAVSPNKRINLDTEDGIAKLQARVDALADVFVAKVARNRGVDVDTVLTNFGQGDVFVGQAAISAGLADRIGSFEGVISELKTRAYGFSSKTVAAGDINHEVTMPDNNGAPAADPKPSTLTAAQVAEQHPQAVEALRTEAHATGMGEGAKAERERVKAILGSDEASGRDELARHLAFDGDLTAEQAVAMLGKAPKASAASGFDKLNAAMQREGNANVGADNDSDAGEDKAHASLIKTAKAIGLA